MLRSVLLIQNATLGFVFAEIAIFIVAVLLPKQGSLIVGGSALAIFIPLFFIFLITLTFGPVARNWRLITVIIGMIVANVLIIILLFANEYRWLDFKDGKICFLDAMYFSVVTWTTLGYGDISPLGAARAFAAIEAFVGYMIMGLLVAALTVMAQKPEHPNY